MAERKLMAGHAVRRLRYRVGLSQVAMADALGISGSYLNLVERNQRPVSAALLVRLAERFDFDPRLLAAGEPGGGADALRRRLADPMFGDLEIDRHELGEWLAAAPGGAEAFARAYDRGGGGIDGTRVAPADDPATAVRAAVERWGNHFPDLDAHAEGVADEVRLGGGDLGAGVAERLRVRHAIGVRILPVEVMPAARRRLDLHARQLQLSEMLGPEQRQFEAAVQLAQIEARGEIDAVARGAALALPADRLFRRHLQAYWAAALVMPYARFLRACEATGYDLDILPRRFGASFEQVAHRLTTLGRIGARGLSFFLIRVDRAGQVSKRFAGAGNAGLVAAEGRCPLWRLHHAFDRPGQVMRQLVELDGDGDAPGLRWLTATRAVSPPQAKVGDVMAAFAIGVGVEARAAAGLSMARGIDLAGAATPIGLGCRACRRAECPQRSAPPDRRALTGDRI